jgi:hypothetical protein
MSTVPTRDVIGSNDDPSKEGHTMRFLSLIFIDEAVYADATPEQYQDVLAAHGAFGEAAGAAGVLVGGEGLQPAATATTLRVRDDERMLVDGPFAETKEQLGGFYLLECKDLDEALSWAERIPEVALGGAVEVRPVMDFSGTAGAAPAQEAAAS